MKPLPAVVLLLFAGVAVADDAANKKLLRDLQGSYFPTSMTGAGEARPDDFLKAASFVIKGDTFTFRFKRGDKEEVKTATIGVDADQKPAAIDLTPKDGPDAGKPMLGIVKADRDAVTLCWSDKRDKPDRPKDFNSTKENGYFLIVMKKAKD